MILVLMVASFVLAIIMRELHYKKESDSDDTITMYGTFSVLFFMAFVIMVITSISLGVDVSTDRALNTKIKMYENENKNIESDINGLVEKYIAHESDTFSSLKDSDGISLISMYPELKADELVKKQIDIYVNNNKKIKRLKSEQIDLTTEKWWLYFGK